MANVITSFEYAADYRIMRGVTRLVIPWELKHFFRKVIQVRELHPGRYVDPDGGTVFSCGEREDQ